MKCCMCNRDLREGERIFRFEGDPDPESACEDCSPTVNQCVMMIESRSASAEGDADHLADLRRLQSRYQGDSRVFTDVYTVHAGGRA